MNLKAVKPFYALMTLALIVGLVPVFNIVTAQARPKIFIDPASNEFTGDIKHVNDTFAVNIVAADWGEPGVYSWQCKLTYDKTLLAPVKNKTGMLADNWISALILKETNGTIENGNIIFASTMTGDDKVVGGGILAFATFKIIAEPPAGGEVGCDLALTEVIIVNPTNLQKYPDASYDVIGGTYKLTAPPPPWGLRINPDLVVASAVGEHVTINIEIYGVTTDAKIVGVQFRMNYPDFLATTADNVTEGEFFAAFGDTFFTAVAETDATGKPFALALSFLLPDDNGVWTVFPEGSGTLATVTFEVVSLPEETATFPITLTNVMMIDNESNLVPYRPVENGAIMAPLKPEDVNADGSVNILDISLWASAFGAPPTSDRYDQRADVNRDGKINIVDAAMIAKSFGFQG